MSGRDKAYIKWACTSVVMGVMTAIAMLMTWLIHWTFKNWGCP